MTGIYQDHPHPDKKKLETNELILSLSWPVFDLPGCPKDKAGVETRIAGIGTRGSLRPKCRSFEGILVPK